MFDKLRYKFILSNMFISTAIIVAAFVTIFTVSAANMPSPKLIADTITWLDENSVAEVRALLEERMRTNNSERLSDLALILVIVGIAMEALVFAASYYLAEKAIYPIRDSYAKQREFIANASHELKTPLTVVRANFEALGTNEQPWTGNIESNLSRANNLISDLLLLARIDSAPKNLIQKTKTNVSLLIKEQAKCFEPKLGGKTLKFNLDKNATLSLNAPDLAQIINILVDNAIKYSSNIIKISLEQKTITIMNDSKTIPPAKLEKIFDRFYQVDKTTEGSGLGLSIAKEIANKNNWQLTAASKRGLTTFTIVL